MTTNHTPGPWAVRDVSSRNEHICFRILSACQTPGIAGVYKDPCSAANARLIAAAPDLLAALEAVVSKVDFERGTSGSEFEDQADDLLNIVFATIAKARAKGEA